MSYQPSIQIDVLQTLHTTERQHLDAATPPAAPVWGQLEGVPFVHILGLARFWEGGDAVTFHQSVEDLVAGVCGQALPLLFLVLGEPRGVQVYLGLEGPGAEDTLRISLTAAFPGVLLGEQPSLKLGSTLNGQGYFTHQGRLTGIPSRKPGHPVNQLADQPTDQRTSTPTVRPTRPSATVLQVERLLRGLYGQAWGYFVRAAPVEPVKVARQTQQLFEQLSAISGHVDWQHSRQAQTLQTVGPNQQRGESESLNRTVTDYRARRCLQLLDRQAQRLETGKAQGMWQTDVHFFTREPATLGQMRTLLGAVFSGPDSTPDPIRTFACHRESPRQTGEFTTLLHSGEVATLVQLPRQEFPGYRVADYARFDTDPLAVPDPAGSVNVGKILEGERPTGNWFIIPRRDFAKHGMVVGVTGSGKTNTLFYLLDKLWDAGRGVPFLVIEPAKAEYRQLLAIPGLENLRVYTLGDETVAPFRLNPFEFEVGSAARIHVQTHIDYLKSAFNAAFILYAPMPYVLETCLHEIYQDRGWDLTTSLNRRLSPQEQGNEPHWPVFPTLSDLYHKIDQVVERLGYEERIKMDVRAGLQTRVGSLMLGGKGLMLDTAHSVSMAELLSHPTVLELERIGNDDEKALLIGLILTRLYEHRRLQAQAAVRANGLQHVAVFEEAHRLLKHVPTEVETEAANVKGQAVETFANMLSEIRAYGQGILIAEQIPTKLSPDAVKNTNLKLMHRVVAVDDREVMGGTMNLDEAQRRAVASLPVGRAVAYAEGADGSYLLQIVNYKRRLDGQRVHDVQIAQAMQQAVQSPLYDPTPGYSQYIARVHSRFDPGLRDRALTIMRHPEFPRTWAGYFLSALLEPARAVQGYTALLQLQRGLTGGLGPDAERQTMLALLLHASAGYFEAQGRAYGWFYDVAEHLRAQFVAVGARVVQGFENDQETLAHLAGAVEPPLRAFAEAYRQQVTREVGPFSGCAFCARRCLYRHEVGSLVIDEVLERDFVSAMRETRDDQAMWRGLARLASDAAAQVVAVEDAAVAREAALCYATQMGARLGFSSANQRKLVKNVRRIMTSPARKGGG
jgi:hypothetical protein